MCGLVLFDKSWRLIRNSSEILEGKKIIGFGDLRYYEKDFSLEVAVLEYQGLGNFEIVSDRAIKGTVEEMMIALHGFGFTILEEQCQIVLDFIQTLVGKKKNN